MVFADSKCVKPGLICALNLVDQVVQAITRANCIAFYSERSREAIDSNLHGNTSRKVVLILSSFSRGSGYPCGKRPSEFLLRLAKDFTDGLHTWSLLSNISGAGPTGPEPPSIFFW